ncbi:hypothetical protein BV898_00719 [Hypsibius exemplaris]|uniref:Uncharacterized protein n=1 Tax=Hypsibius exemplaris TaxID=2072580 RepID=A0A1W0XEA1_HYPEX|nr:hypothetical protein BV898_00719 [Hypsibius exemplaris]
MKMVLVSVLFLIITQRARCTNYDLQEWSSTTNAPKIKSYTIVSPVLLTPQILVSAVFTGPAMEIAVQEVNELYKNHFQLSLRLLASPKTADCVSMMFNIQDVFSEYIFRGRSLDRTPDESDDDEIAAIVAPGLS